MAKLSAHGNELLRHEGLNYRLAYMSDGKILRDQGDGWKLYRHLKPGVDPLEHASKMRSFYDQPTPERIMRASLRERMTEEFPGLETRIKVFSCIELMPDDPDGIWSTLEDYGENVDLDTLVELCRLWQSARREGDEAAARKKEIAITPA